MTNIPLFKIHWNKSDYESIKSVIKSGMHWTNGKEVEDFEKALSSYLGKKYCLTFNSGTSAGHALLEALDVKGREVIVPSFSFIGTANVVLMAGGIPVFADIEKDTLGLSPLSVEKKITNKTVAVMPMHYGGGACNINELKSLCDNRDLILIEDAAESLGAKVGSERVGSFGKAAWFSFAQNKMISTGEGGALVTDDALLYETCKLVRSHGRLETSNYFTSNDYFDYIRLGYNFRLSSINAALGKSQLDGIESNINSRRRIASFYNDLFRSKKEFELIRGLPDSHNVYQLYSVLLKKASNRNKLISFLTENQVFSKVYFTPIHQTTFYSKLGYKDVDLKITCDISDRIISLPIYPGLSSNNQLVVKELIEEFVRNVN